MGCGHLQRIGGGNMGADAGQGTVEAAFTIPVVFLLLLLLLQPGIYLYDRTVMEGAAAEGCRILATAGADEADLVEEYVLRRLGAIPQADLFHVHGGSCSYEVELNGNETTDAVSVTVSNRLRPLPLLDAVSALLGLTDGDGCLTVQAHAEARTQPAWVNDSRAGKEPSEWIGGWMDEG